MIELEKHLFLLQKMMKYILVKVSWAKSVCISTSKLELCCGIYSMYVCSFTVIFLLLDN